MPRVTGEELVTAMRANVAEAMANHAKARTNLHRLRLDGKIVIDERTNQLRPTTVGEGRRRKPDPDGDLGLSDWYRATSELAHWQEYLEWAKAKRDAELQDPRLPPEHDPEPDNPPRHVEDEEIPF